MSSKQKFLYVFLIIITFGFILLYWKKYRQNTTKNYLSVEEKLNFDINEFIECLGDKENIKEIVSTQKVLTIFYFQKNKINMNKIQTLKGIKGISIKSESISFVLGNSSMYVKELILKEIQK